MQKQKNQTKKIKTYYKQLKDDFKLSEYLEIFKTDFTKHDRECLYRYTGDFILACRKTGTNLVKMIPNASGILSCKNCKHNDICEAGDYCERFENRDKDTFDLWILGKCWNYERNKRFFYGHNGIVEEKSNREIEKIFQEYCNVKYKCKFYC